MEATIDQEVNLLIFLDIMFDDCLIFVKKVDDLNKALDWRAKNNVD